MGGKRSASEAPGREMGGGRSVFVDRCWGVSAVIRPTGVSIRAEMLRLDSEEGAGTMGVGVGYSSGRLEESVPPLLDARVGMSSWCSSVGTRMMGVGAGGSSRWRS